MHLFSDKLRRLSELGAGELDHIDGSLIDHLKGTRALLNEWSASPELQDAGLYHAVYGTAGFDENLVSTRQRVAIAKIIGDAAEEIVYQYCACDRADFFPRVGLEANPEFKNRFTGERYYLDDALLKQFCELTAANEIEIALGNRLHVIEHGADLYDLLRRMAPYLSEPAQNKVEEVFGAASA